MKINLKLSSDRSGIFIMQNFRNVFKIELFGLFISLYVYRYILRDTHPSSTRCSTSHLASLYRQNFEKPYFNPLFDRFVCDQYVL